MKSCIPVRKNSHLKVFSRKWVLNSFGKYVRKCYIKFLHSNSWYVPYHYYTVNSEIFARVYFRETSHMRSFVKIKLSQYGEIFLSFTDIGKSCPGREILTWQICLLTLFAKLKFSRKFPNLQYQHGVVVLGGYRKTKTIISTFFMFSIKH